MTRRDQTPGRRGMTLIEVLLAVTILGTSLVALLAAASRCVAIMKRARIYQEAQYALSAGEVDHPLSEAKTLDDIPVSGETYGDAFVFSRDVENVDDEDEKELHIVRTRVTWERNGGQGIEETVQYILVPEEEQEGSAAP